MTIDPSALASLSARWRQEFQRVSSFHATMGSGWLACADDLDALIASAAPSPPWQPSAIEGIPDEGRFLTARQIQQVMDALESDEETWRRDAFEMIQELYELGSVASTAPSGWQPIASAPKDVKVLRYGRR